MNKIVLLLLIAMSTRIGAQERSFLPIDDRTGKVTYAAVVEVPNKAKNVLFQELKKWIQTKHTDANPYVISYEHMERGSMVCKSSFTMPIDDRKYNVGFVLNVDMKDERYRYKLTDIVIEYTTQGGVSHGGYSMWSSTTYRQAETLSYTVETFYPIHLEKRRKPSIKWYELINKYSFEMIDKEINSIITSLRQHLSEMTSKW